MRSRSFACVLPAPRRARERDRRRPGDTTVDIDKESRIVDPSRLRQAEVELSRGHGHGKASGKALRTERSDARPVAAVRQAPHGAAKSAPAKGSGGRKGQNEFGKGGKGKAPRRDTSSDPRRARAAPGLWRFSETNDANAAPLAEPRPVGRGQRLVPVVFERVTRGAPLAPSVGAQRWGARACAQAAACPDEMHIELAWECETSAGGTGYSRTPRTRSRASRLLRAKPGGDTCPFLSAPGSNCEKIGARAARPRGPGICDRSAHGRLRRRVRLLGLNLR